MLQSSPSFTLPARRAPKRISVDTGRGLPAPEARSLSSSSIGRLHQPGHCHRAGERKGEKGVWSLGPRTQEGGRGKKHRNNSRGIRLRSVMAWGALNILRV